VPRKAPVDDEGGVHGDPPVSRQRRYAVRPGLDPALYAIVLVGRDGDLLAGEVHEEQFPVGVVAFEGRRVACRPSELWAGMPPWAVVFAVSARIAVIPR